MIVDFQFQLQHVKNLEVITHTLEERDEKTENQSFSQTHQRTDVAWQIATPKSR